MVGSYTVVLVSLLMALIGLRRLRFWLLAAFPGVRSQYLYSGVVIWWFAGGASFALSAKGGCVMGRLNLFRCSPLVREVTWLDVG